MKKILCAFAALMILLSAAACGMSESLFVDNRETDKIYPERLNLRAQPSKNGAILGLYYTGTEVTVLAADSDGYTKVEVGGATGYMATEYLIPENEITARYGENSGFGNGRAAEVDLTGMWMTSVSLLEETDESSSKLAGIESGTRVGLMGVLDTWAYIRVEADGETKLGYVPLDVLTDVDELKVSIISSGKTDKKTLLYDAPTNKAKPIMTLSNGTACFSLFGRKEGEWRRVRVGGVSGWIKYTQTGNLYALGTQMRSVVPYYPLLMQTKSDTLLYRVKGDKTERYMTLGQGMYVELLAESDNYAYVRTSEGGAGAYNCGDFGYIPIADLSLAQTGQSIGVAQADDADLPVIVLNDPEKKDEVIGALCSGAEARITSYTQTDYIQIQLGTLVGYVPKNQIRVLTDAAEPLSDRIPQRATVKAETELRARPEDKAAVSESIAAGTRVYMLGKFGDWAYVRASDTPAFDVNDPSADHTGFIRLSSLSAPASTTHLTAFVTKDKVNLRSEPNSQSGDIIGKARTGARMRVTDYGNQWTGVVLEDGKRGYIMTEYLQFE